MALCAHKIVARFLPFFHSAMLCSSTSTHTDGVCCLFLNQFFSITELKERCHDNIQRPNSVSGGLWGLLKPIAKIHPYPKASIGHSIQFIHGHSHHSSKCKYCRIVILSQSPPHCDGYSLLYSNH